MSNTDDTRGLSAMGSTFAERKAAREQYEAEATGKQVRNEGDVEDKAVKASETKKRPARKKA